jgi:hypothetical protein
VGQVLVGPDNQLLAERDFLGEIDHTFGRASWIGTYRYLDFNGAWMSVFSPAVIVVGTDRLSLGVAGPTPVDGPTLSGQRARQHVHARAAYRFRPRLWLPRATHEASRISRPSRLTRLETSRQIRLPEGSASISRASPPSSAATTTSGA